VYEGRLSGESRSAGMHPPFSDRLELAFSTIKGKPALPVNFTPAFTVRGQGEGGRSQGLGIE